MTIQKLPGAAIAPGTITVVQLESSVANTVQTGGGPKLTNIQITDNAYTVLDDTAVALTGGYIKITGTGFVTGCTVIIGSVVATSVSFISATEVRAQVPAQAAGTYTVYLVNPDGGVGIRVNGLNYSGTPTWSTTSPLPGGVKDSAISIQLMATSNSAVTYTLAQGSTLPTGLTLSSSGLLSGTITGIATETTYNFTIVATDAENQDTPQAFSITISVADPYFRFTTLLLQADTAPNVLSDASSNNFALTAYGDSRASNFTPYGGAWSAYLSGSTSSGLTIAGTSSLLGAGVSYTFEGWFRFFATSVTDNHWLFGAGSYPNRWNTDISVLASTIQGRVVTENNAVLWSGSSVAYTFGSWVHIAIVNNATANTFTFYFNGVNAGSTTAVSLLSYASHRVGTQATNILHASSLRLVSGQALYTGNFTPSTSTLTISAVGTTGANVAASLTGTVGYLVCHTNRFVDATGKAVTLSGTPQISSSNPFNVTNTGVDGSLYVDGTGDYVGLADSAVLDAAGDFTLECWFYPTSNPTDAGIVVMNNGGSSATAGAAIRYSNAQFGFEVSGGNINSGASVLYQWHHLALVRNGSGANNVKAYLQGNLIGQVSSTSTQLPPQGMVIGRYYTGVDNYYAQGYIADVRYVVGTAVYTANFTPATSRLTAVANTQVLTCQYDFPHNNHTFLDSSTNQFLLTRYGNATQGTFSPFSQTGWGNYLGTTNTRVYSNSSTDFYLGTSNFCYEGFIYATSALSGYSRGFGIGPYYNNINSFGVMIYDTDNSGYITVYFNDGSIGRKLISSQTLTLNTWNHIAVVRSGSNYALFLNGTRRATYTSSNAIGDGSATYGFVGTTDNANEGFIGYASNIRLIKGSSVYDPTSLTINVPTTPFATNTTNQVLLTCQANRFVDSNTATTAKTLTASGSPSVQAFSPFNPTSSWSATTNGGSGYFDGTGDYLTVANNSAFDITQGDFTWECWIYRTVSGVDQEIANQRTNSPSVTGWLVRLNTSNKIVLSFVGSAYNITSSSSIVNNQWTHIAVTRSGSTARLFINGNLDVTNSSFSNGLTSTSTLTIGKDEGSTGLYTGYLSNWRLVKGLAVYTAAFTPPTEPFTATQSANTNGNPSAAITGSSTSLLLNFTNAGIYDATSKNDLETVADAKISTAQSKWGGSSMAFDGTGDYLYLSSSNQNFSLGPTFTIEFWIYNTKTSGFGGIIGHTGTNWYTGIPVTYVSGAASTFTLNSYAGSLSKASLANNTWYHVAIVANNNSASLYVNGNLESGPLSQAVTGTPSYLTIGRHDGTNSIGDWSGYLQDLRITRGYARYTANFTPPTAAFQTL